MRQAAEVDVQLIRTEVREKYHGNQVKICILGIATVEPLTIPISGSVECFCCMFHVYLLGAVSQVQCTTAHNTTRQQKRSEAECMQSKGDTQSQCVLK